MKNKFIALALVTLSIATTTVSCTKDDVNPTDVKAQNVETTKVDFKVNADNGVSATGRMVDRAAAPLYVDNLTITATCIGLGQPFVATELFTFGSGSGVATGFGLNGVALGVNQFTASSTSANANKKLSLGQVIMPNSGSQNVLEVMKANTPYITTATASPVTATIVKGTNSPIALDMTTNNGRILAKFVQEPQADNYYTTVSAVAGGVNLGESILSPAPSGGISPTALGFQWSNENAVDGALVTFTFKIYEKGTNGALQGALLNTVTKTVNVVKAKNIMATYTIKNTDVVTDIQAGGIVLTFPTIADLPIND